MTSNFSNIFMKNFIEKIRCDRKIWFVSISLGFLPLIFYSFIRTSILSEIRQFVGFHHVGLLLLAKELSKEEE